MKEISIDKCLNLKCKMLWKRTHVSTLTTLWKIDCVFEVTCSIKLIWNNYLHPLGQWLQSKGQFSLMFICCEHMYIHEKILVHSSEGWWPMLVALLFSYPKGEAGSFVIWRSDCQRWNCGCFQKRVIDEKVCTCKNHCSLIHPQPAYYSYPFNNLKAKDCFGALHIEYK